MFLYRYHKLIKIYANFKKERLLSSSIFNCFLFKRVHKHRIIKEFSTPISLPVLPAALEKARTNSELNDIKLIL